jgi:hypothetical protein
VLRSTNITTLGLCYCNGYDLVSPLLQGLASPFSSAHLTKMMFSCFHDDDSDSDGTLHSATALRAYLESPSATIRCLELYDGDDNVHSMFYEILQGLSRNTLLEELKFDNCQTDQLDTEFDDLLGLCILNKPNLSTLVCCSSNNFGHHQSFEDAMVEILTRPESTLRHLKIEVSRLFSDVKGFMRLMNVITQNTLLEDLSLEARHDVFFTHRSYYQILLHAIPMLKVKTFSIDFERNRSQNDEDQNALLAAFKTNYAVHSVRCVWREAFHVPSCATLDWFSERNKSRLDFYLFRNKKLAGWIENPSSVHSELWPEAMALAQRAGSDALYRSLLAFSGECVSLGRRRHSRKRPKIKPM